MPTPRLSTKTKEYKAWNNMRQRCYDSGNASYRYYGGRGIKVCSRWNIFSNFLADMRVAPSPSHSLDRIDNNGDYSPENCRWATRKEQQRNLRNNTLLTLGPDTLTVAEWAERLHIPDVTLRSRLRMGWSNNAILTTPIRRRFLTYEGKTQSLSAWAKELDIKRTTLRMRLDEYGWDLERALTTKERMR